MRFQRITKVLNVFLRQNCRTCTVLLYLSNGAAATSALCFPYECCTNYISENKTGPSPAIFLGLFHCCGMSVQVLSSGIMANQVKHSRECYTTSSNMFTTSTSSGFAIALCTKNVARDLAAIVTEETMAVCSKTRWKPNHPDMVITKQAISFLFVLHCTSSKCSSCSAPLILSNIF